MQNPSLVNSTIKVDMPPWMRPALVQLAEDLENPEKGLVRKTAASGAHRGLNAQRLAKRIVAATLALTVLTGLQTAFASGQVTNVPINFASVTQAASGTTSAFFVYLSVVIGGTPPACATQNTRFVVDLSTPAGQATMAAILAAHLTGQTLDITGRGVCDVWGDTETIAWMNVH